MFKEKPFLYFWLVLVLVLTVLLQACGNEVGVTLPSPTPVFSPSITNAAATVGVATTAPLTTVSTTAAAPTTTQPTATPNLTTAAATTLPEQTTSAFSTPPTGSTTTPGATLPRFEAAAACPFILPKGQTLGQTAKCGYVFVPESHTQPNNGRTIKLAVLVYKSTEPNPAEPVIYLSGGPGFPIQSTIYAMTGDFLNGFTAHGDAIFFDQRGVDNSRPELFCPEIEAQAEKDAPAMLNPTDAAQHSLDAAMACHDRLVKQGVNLAAFNTVESAGDVNDIRQALGYQKVNIYGVSYGTLLAQTVMRLYPQIVRSVVLDSVVPPDLHTGNVFIPSGSRTMNLIFQACAADPTCNRQYPDLKGLFNKTYNLLNTTQPVVKVTVPTTGATFNLKVDGDQFLATLFLFLYNKGNVQVVPKTIALLSTGNTDTLASLMAQIFENNLIADLGMSYSVGCAEGPSATEPPDNQTEAVQGFPLFPQERAANVPSSNSFCQKWNVPLASQDQNTLVKSDLPTLVLEGQFDPITPPVYGQRVAQNLSKSFYVEFPYNGHGEVFPDNPCGINIMRAFLDNPGARPDSSCTSALTLTFS